MAVNAKEYNPSAGGGGSGGLTYISTFSGAQASPLDISGLLGDSVRGYLFLITVIDTGTGGCNLEFGANGGVTDLRMLKIACTTSAVVHQSRSDWDSVDSGASNGAYAKGWVKVLTDRTYGHVAVFEQMSVYTAAGAQIQHYSGGGTWAGAGQFTGFQIVESRSTAPAFEVDVFALTDE